MTQSHALEKLFHGKPLHLDEKKEIEGILVNQPRKKTCLFTKKSKLEQQIFEKYIKNFNLKEFSAYFFENCELFLKENLNTEEKEKIKSFKILNDLIKSIELENNLKNKLLNKINQIETFKKFNESEKKSLVNIIVSFCSEINSYNNNII